MKPAPPLTRIVGKAILPVGDLTEAMAFYEGLGFEVETYDSGYAWVRHGGGEILHLQVAPGLRPDANHASCYLHVQDADAWHAAWREFGVTVGQLTDRPWGMREFSLTDPSGNLIRIGHNL